MRLSRLLGSILLLGLAFLGWSALRGEQEVVALQPDAVVATSPRDTVLAATKHAIVRVPADAEDPQQRTLAAPEAEARLVRGNLRDLRTGKPIPEVRIALERGSEIEIVVTSLDGEFVSERAYAPGPLTIDPTPFADDDADWYSLAVGERREVSLETGEDAHFELIVDAPAFVLLDGVAADVHPKGPRRANLLLPGAEQPGWEGSTWVPFRARRAARYTKRSSDDALLVVPAAFSSDDLVPRALGSGPARIEIAGLWFDPRWYSTGALQLRDGRILDVRAQVHERTDCGTIRVDVRDERGERIRAGLASIVVHALSPLVRPEMPAARRDEADWARRFDILGNERLDLALGQQAGNWTSGPLPIASYEVEVEHPRYEVAREIVQLERGRTTLARIDLIPSKVGPPLHLSAVWSARDAPRPSVKWKLTRLRDDGTPYRWGYTTSRLGEDASGRLSTERPAAVLEGLPAARYAVDLCADSVGDLPCFPIPITPANPILDADHPLEVSVDNGALQPWRLEIGPERINEEWRYGTREFCLELFATDGSTLGTLTCYLERGVLSLYAPAEGVARFEFTERGVSSSGRRFRGSWRADLEEGVGGGRQRVLVLR